MSRRLLLAGIRLLLRVFFRELEVSGLDRVPADRGGLFVSWHPNSLIDPSLILEVPRDGLYLDLLRGIPLRREPVLHPFDKLRYGRRRDGSERLSIDTWNVAVVDLVLLALQA